MQGILKHLRNIRLQGNLLPLATLAAWGLVLALGMAFASSPVGNISSLLCTIAKWLTNKTLIFGVLLVIVAWTGYMIYMGKREATDTIVKAIIATAILLSTGLIGRALVSGADGSCEL